MYCTHSRDADIVGPGADKVSAVMAEGQPLIRGANSPLARLRSLLVRAPQSMPLSKDNCAWAERVALAVESTLSGSQERVAAVGATQVPIRRARVTTARLDKAANRSPVDRGGELAQDVKDVLVMNSSKPRRPDVTTVEIIGGPEALEVGLGSYDARWAEVYLHHRRRILDALAAVDVDVEHIGSTSVPGLAAKPIVDIVVAVADITAEEDYLDGLLAAGYELRVREPGHRLVRTPTRDVHVHVYERGDAAVHEYLLFRDHLRTNADDRALYESVKRALLSQQWNDMNDYADAKNDVIFAIKTRARATRQ